MGEAGDGLNSGGAHVNSQGNNAMSGDSNVSSGDAHVNSGDENENSGSIDISDVKVFLYFIEIPRIWYPLQGPYFFCLFFDWQ